MDERLSEPGEAGASLHPGPQGGGDLHGRAQVGPRDQECHEQDMCSLGDQFQAVSGILSNVAQK